MEEGVGGSHFLSWLQAEGAPSNGISIIRMHFYSDSYNLSNCGDIQLKPGIQDVHFS